MSCKCWEGTELVMDFVVEVVVEFVVEVVVEFVRQVEDMDGWLSMCCCSLIGW